MIKYRQTVQDLVSFLQFKYGTFDQDSPQGIKKILEWEI